MSSHKLITASRYHDISCGHRVHGHESKCAHLHGHNYRVHFTVAQVSGGKQVDEIGRVLDFSVIKDKLCMWLEKNWDHKFLAWRNDTYIRSLSSLITDTGNDPKCADAMYGAAEMFCGSLVVVPFNPTAENMARYLVSVVGPAEFVGTGCKLIEVTIEETAKCSATYKLEEF